MEQQEKFSLERIIIFGQFLDTLKSFYVENFGFSVSEEIKNQWIVLNAGAIEIAIHNIGEGYDVSEVTGYQVESNTKLVFHTREDLINIRKRFIEKGIIIGEIKSFEGFNSLFCDGEDPEGNIFQIEQRMD